MTRKRLALGALALAFMMLAVAACSGDDDGRADTAGTTALGTATAATTRPSTAVTTTTPPTTAAPTRYYLSLGDSYASGFEPGVGNTRNGFPYQVEELARASAQPLQLVNVACAGATTASLLNDKGCPAGALGPGSTPYDAQTQLEAAEAFLRAHPGEVPLVSVSIGGNDVTRCARQTDVAGCVGGGLSTINANLSVIAQRLRAAAGPTALIVGTTYPDVILGAWVTNPANGQQLAALSVGAFRSLINPALASAYASVNGQFVDVTAATGAYGPLTELTTLAPYGSIPVPVAKVCQLTYFCAQQDIHPNRDGYKVIADLVYGSYSASQPTG